MKRLQHQLITIIGACLLVTMGLSCYREPLCPLSPEGENCTHLLSVKPERIELGKVTTQPLTARFAELSIADELPSATDLEVSLNQSGRSVRLQVVTIMGREVTAQANPSDLANLQPGATNLVVRYHRPGGLRSASHAITLTRPVQFEKAATVIPFDAKKPSAIEPSQVAIVPKNSPFRKALGGLAMVAFFPQSTSGEDAHRVCFFDADKLAGALITTPTEPVKELHCPLPGCPGCPIGIDSSGCVLRLRKDNDYWRTLVRTSDSMLCKDEQAPEGLHYPINSLLASDPNSELLAIASPPPQNQQDSIFWLVSSATLSEQYIDTLRNRAIAALAVGDLNGDGKADALAVSRSPTLLDAQVWVQREDAFQRDYPLTSALNQQLQKVAKEKDGDARIITRTPIAMALSDMDQDGHLDVVILSRNQGKLSQQNLAIDLIVNLGGDGLASPIRVALPTNVADDTHFASAQLTVGDVNEDGAPDLVLTAYGGPIAVVRQSIK